MAKNTLQKRKRVALVKGVLDNEIEGECRDYVSSIIKDMDSSFKPAKLNKLTDVSQPSNFSKINSKRKNNSTPCSKDNAQNLNVSKYKKFSLARKFPLMEKSQKILKHLKHNQCIPKQRAHLGSFPASPSKKKCNAKVSIKKKAKNISLDRNLHNTDKPCVNKDLRFNSSKKSKMPTKEIDKFNTECKYNFRDSKVENLDSISVENYSIDDDTTDSEYERFIINNKTQKKKYNKQKTSDKTKNSRKSSQKTRKKNVWQALPKFSDSDSNDELSCDKYEQNKKIKVSHDSCKTNHCASPSKSINVNDNYANGMSSDNDIIDGEIRGALSESDVENMDETVGNSSNCQFENKSSRHCLSPKPHSCVKNNVVDTCSKYVSQNEVQDDLVTEKCFKQNSSSSDSLIINKGDCENGISYSNNCVMQNKTQSTVLLLPDEDSDIEILDVVLLDLTKSKVRNMQETGFLGDALINKSNDEICEVNSRCSFKTEKLHDMQIQLKFEDKEQKVKQDEDKCEVVYSTNICKVNVLKQENSSLYGIHNTLKHSVSHNNEMKLYKRTKEEESDDDVIIDCEISVTSSNKMSRISSSSLSFLQGTKTKVEVESTKYFNDSKSVMISKSNSDQHTRFIESKTCNRNQNIKNENSFKDLTSLNKTDLLPCNKNVTVKELKLYEVACSNLACTQHVLDKKSLLSVQSEKPNEKDANVVDLLERFKHEFEEYQKILQAEAYAEAGFKCMETRQAERLKELKSEIMKKVMENKQYANEDLKMNGQIGLCKTQEINNLQTSNNGLQLSPSCSSKVVSEDLKNPLMKTQMLNFTTSITAQIVSPPADVKPNLYLSSKSLPFQDLVARPKLETASIYESTTDSKINTIILLEEMCNVCGKEAVAACERCAKVFFCSNECGKKSWNDGHGNECSK